jgi:hypothetical protein
VTFDPVAQ